MPAGYSCAFPVVCVPPAHHLPTVSRVFFKWERRLARSGMRKMAHGRRGTPGVVQLHGLAFGFGMIDINQQNLRRQAAQEESVGEGGTHVASTVDGDARGVGRCLFHRMGWPTAHGSCGRPYALWRPAEVPPMTPSATTNDRRGYGNAAPADSGRVSLPRSASRAAYPSGIGTRTRRPCRAGTRPARSRLQAASRSS